jgi:hypothetical protein
MATSSYPPNRESELVPFSLNFKTKIALTPTAYGLTALQATGYGTKHDDFVAKWNVCQDPATKTKMAVELKNASKSVLLDDLRMLGRIVQNFPGTTDAMRIDLGLPVRDPAPSPINPPTEKPVLEIVKVHGRLVSVRLRSMDSEGRGRPPGVWGASICSFVGSAPPTDVGAWKLEGESTRTDFDVEFASTVPAGAQVWLTAYWKNPRLMSGPPCDPISIYLGGGLAAAA